MAIVIRLRHQGVGLRHEDASEETRISRACSEGEFAAALPGPFLLGLFLDVRRFLGN